MANSVLTALLLIVCLSAVLAIAQAASCSLKVDAFASTDCSGDSLQCVDDPTSCAFLMDHENGNYTYLAANCTGLEVNLYTTSDCSGSPYALYSDNECTDVFGIGLRFNFGAKCGASALGNWVDLFF